MKESGVAVSFGTLCITRFEGAWGCWDISDRKQQGGQRQSLLYSIYLQIELECEDTVWKGVRQPLVISCLGNSALLIHLPTLMQFVCASFFVRQEGCVRFSWCFGIWFVSQNATTPTSPWSNLLGILDWTKSKPSYFSTLHLTSPVCLWQHISAVPAFSIYILTVKGGTKNTISFT